MDAKRKRHAEYRKKPKGYYHLSTDGRPDVLLFRTKEEYAMGMTAIALVAIRFKVQIYVFELMPNHIHIVLSATGNTCVEIFEFIVRRISRQLKSDGYPPLPEDYDFRLTDIEDPKSFLDHYIYAARNPFEKGWCVPGGYLWGSDYLLFSGWGNFVKGIRAGDMSQRELYRITKTRIKIPADWEIHPELGILPKNYIALDKVKQLFPDAKQYLTRCVKDYESFVYLADSLGESLSFSSEEVEDLLQRLLRDHYSQRPLPDLSADEKCRLAVILNDKFRVEPSLIARKMGLPVRIVNQTLRSKDFGVRKKKR